MNFKRYTKEYEELARNFTCGNIIIDNFLKDGSALDKMKGITYVMLSDEEDFIIGYYNIEAGRVDFVENINGQDIYEPMGGAVNINYLAVHSDFQRYKVAESNGKNIYLGDLLLHDCEKRILDLSDKLGICFITLCSTKEGYNLYHERNDFENFEEDMSMVVGESDAQCYKLYKCIDDII